MLKVRLKWLLAMLLVAGAVHAQERNLVVGEQRVALVIGNNNYKEAPLANPANDAADLAKALEESGFKVILKTNVGTREMRQAIREYGRELRRAHVGLFYFAGHGIQVRGVNYLVPVDADIQGEADAEDLAIDANYALRTMEESQVKVSIVILDACRNNPFARSFRSTSRGLTQMTAATGSVIAFATAPGSVAADGTGRNGIYTKHLLNSMRETDTDILKVFQRTRAGVVRETQGRQTPWESTSLIGDFHFRPPTGTTQVAVVAPPATSVVPTTTASAERTPSSGTQVAMAAPAAVVQAAALSTTGRTPASGTPGEGALQACPGSFNPKTWTNCSGELTFPDGSKYSGSFRNGLREGQGSYTFPDGSRYTGEFKDNRRHGRGTYIFADGKQYAGEFKDDKFDGRGTVTYPDGQTYVGDYRNDKANGQGIYTYPGGHKYVGEFRDDMRNGQGTYTFADGKQYVGEFRDDKFDGRGTYTFPNGHKFVGEYRDDKANGKGTEYNADGTIARSGIWKNDEFVASQ